jgi:hypothetical protein
MPSSIRHGRLFLHYICRMVKKHILLSMVVLWCGNVSAQVTDTLGFQSFLEGTESLYSSPNGGYAFGNNGYGDRAKAQTFTHDHAFVLRSVLVKFGAVQYTSNNPNSVVRVNVYDNYNAGVTTSGPIDSIAPDSVLGYFDIPVSSILTDGNYTEANFSFDTLAIFSSFSVGVDFTFLAPGDTVGLITTTDGDAMERQNTWEQVSNGTWITTISPYSWALDVDLAIFPVIDENDPAGISDVAPLQLAVYPNPTSGSITIELPHFDVWNMELVTMDGKLLLQNASASNQVNLDLSSYPSGVHVLRMFNHEQLFVNRIVTR